MNIFIHIIREKLDKSRFNDIIGLRQLFPLGTGFLKATQTSFEVVPDAGTGGGQQYFEEVFNITQENTIPQLTFTPKFATKEVWMTIGSGWVKHSVREGGFSVNTATRTVTVAPGGEYRIQVGWQVTMRYATDDVIVAPNITNVAPSTATVGQTVTLTGVGFTANMVVRLGGQIVSANVLSATQATFVIPPLLFANSTIDVQNIIGADSDTSFTFTPPVPTITSFAPVTALASSTVVIMGTNFYGTPTVRFGGVISPTVVINSPTQITATVPSSGASGAITVETLYGTASRNGFTWKHPAPTITNFTPNIALNGASVVITGTNFINVSLVQFGGVNAASFVVNSPTQITATVSTGATGAVTVTNPGGTASANGFTFQSIIILPFPSVAGNRLATGFAGTLANGVTYIIRASKDQYNNRWQAFDDPAASGSSYWYAVGTTSVDEWIEIEFSVPVLVGSVDIIPYPSGYQPRDFRFLLADIHNPAGTGYSTAFTTTNQTWVGNFGETKNYVIPAANRQARKIFRMAITASVSYGNSPAIYSIILKP